MRITWLPRARADVSYTRQYIEQRNPDGAQRVVLAIYAAVRKIAGEPDLGRPGRVREPENWLSPTRPTSSSIPSSEMQSSFSPSSMGHRNGRARSDRNRS